MINRNLFEAKKCSGHLGLRSRLGLAYLHFTSKRQPPFRTHFSSAYEH